MKVIGKQLYEGVYNNNPYKTTHLTVLKEYPNNSVSEGYCTELLKIKDAVCPYDKINIGDEVEAYFDRFKNVAMLNIIKKGEPTE